MSQTVYCPRCQARGAVPDGVPKARIRCPKCEHQFEYVRPAGGGAAAPKAAAPPSSSSSSSSALKTPRPPSSVYEDVEPVRPLSGTGMPGVRRSALAEGPSRAAGSGPSGLVMALAGVSGVAMLLLGVVLVMLLRSPAAAPG